MMSTYNYLYALYVCSFQGTIQFADASATGLKWTRTTDLTLIRRAL